VVVQARPPAPTDIAALTGGPALAPYWTFYRAVTTAHVASWLPRRPSLVLDMSDAHTDHTTQAATAGHRVIALSGHPPAGPPSGPGTGPSASRVHRVTADPTSLSFLPDACCDAVIAGGRVLSRHLVTEATVAEIARVLRPGGRALLCVDSLVLGMAILAEQDYWAHLSDVPRAEVVLVPWPDGTITRCFGAEQLHDLVAEAEMETEWIKPLTVLSPSAVDHALSLDPGSLPRLVRAELASSPGEDSAAMHLLAAARKRT
jgi:SAM-dependent methyltransferase